MAPADVNGIANYKNGMLTVNGNNVTISNNTISSPYGICIIVGNEANPVTGFRLEGNKIRGCGLQNTLTQQDSGSHWVYVSYANQAVITQNHIYNNKIRGLQFWPQVTNSVASYNVLYGSSGNLNLGWQDWAPFKWPSDNVIEHNIIASSTLTGVGKDTHEVYGFMPNDGVQRNNVVRNNCVSNAAHPGSLYGGYGLTIENSNIPAANGTFVDPKFTDPANADFLLQEAVPASARARPTSSRYPSSRGLAASMRQPRATMPRPGHSRPRSPRWPISPADWPRDNTGASRAPRHSSRQADSARSRAAGPKLNPLSSGAPEPDRAGWPDAT